MKPQRLALDHYAQVRRTPWLGYLLLLLTLLAAAALAQRFREVQLTLESRQTTQALLEAPRTPAKAIPKNRLDEQVKNAEAVVRQLTLPWAQLIETIEAAASNDVAILQLQPDAQQRVLRITVEARNQDAMVDYLKRLAELKGMSYVHLLNHQVQQDDPQRPIQFSVQASFKALQ